MESMDQELKSRLARIEGQIRGIHKMVEEGRSCEDIVTQLLAARTALDSVATAILSGHVTECLGTMPPDRAKGAITRALRLLTRVT